MGNVLSSRGQRMAGSTTGDTLPMLTNGPATTNAPLFLDEIDATPAEWSQESKCVVIQRFFGWLPDSTAEKLKQDQRASIYAPRAVVFDLSHAKSRGHAIIIVQRVYRRYRLLRKWHLVSEQVIEIARTLRRERAAQMEEEEMLANFREIMASGFSAQKVSITGALKNIQLQLVLRTDPEECYLTWTPSRKRQPRIDLHDVEEVVPVLKDGNKHAPRLANKVSHRRGLIIVCKSHHRGRVVLQMGSKRERKVLLLGFQRLLDDLNRFAPTLDATGSIRKRLPRRKSAIQFFDKELGQSNDGDASNDDGDDNDDDVDELRGEKPVDDGAGDAELTPVSSPSKLTKRHSASIAKFYQTRFDDSFTNRSVPSSEDEPEPVKSKKPSLPRRSSMVM